MTRQYEAPGSRDALKWCIIGPSSSDDERKRLIRDAP